MDFRADLPREKYLNFWPGKMPFVHQVWEGMGEREETGQREGREGAFGEQLSGHWALC